MWTGVVFCRVWVVVPAYPWQRCGAVAAAVEVVENNAIFEGAIGSMVELIVPAVLSAKGVGGDLLENTFRANVERVVARLLTSGVVIEDLVEQGKLLVVGARYDLEDGVVEFL